MAPHKKYSTESKSWINLLTFGVICNAIFFSWTWAKNSSLPSSAPDDWELKVTDEKKKNLQEDVVHWGHQTNEIVI